MASDTAYIELRSTRRVRKILATATDLTWVFGRRTTMTVLYQSAATSTTAATKKVDTIIHTVEGAPAAALNPTPATNTISAFAIVAPSAATVLAPSIGGSTEAQVPVLDANVEILNVEVLDYIRFSGTGLPAAGLYFDTADVVGIYNVAPTSSDSL